MTRKTTKATSGKTPKARIPEEDIQACLDRAQKALGEGRPEAAWKTLDRKLKKFPKDPRLLHKKGLALARLALTNEALEVVEAIPTAVRDEEILGLLARLEKDLYLQALNSHGEHLARARQHYEAAFRYRPRPWTAINAATLAYLAEDLGAASEWAQKALDLCSAGLEEPFWRQATEGEAWLVLGDLPKARKAYREALHLGLRRFGDLQSTRKNAHLLCLSRGDASMLEELLPFRPWVAALISLPIEAGDPGAEPLTEAQSLRLQEALDRVLDGRFVAAGFSALVQPADRVFLTHLEEAGSVLHLVKTADGDRAAPDPDGWCALAGMRPARVRSITWCQPREEESRSSPLGQSNDLLLCLAQLRSRGIQGCCLALVLMEREVPVDLPASFKGFSEVAVVLRMDRLRAGDPVEDCLQELTLPDVVSKDPEGEIVRLLDRQYGRLALGLAYKRKLNWEAENIRHDVITRIWEKFASFHWNCEPGTWITTIAINELNTRAREENAGVVIATEPSGEEDLLPLVERLADLDQPSALTTAERGNLLSLISRCMSLMPHERQTALALRYFKELSTEEIATRTQTHPGTVRTRINRGLNDLRTYLKAPSAIC